MATGTVKWYSDDKGYGLILRDDGGDDVYVHHTAVKSDGYRTLLNGARVEFDTTEGENGPEAANVTALT